ncbi:MAG: LPS export ABC transporter periplasmic protein LptC [Azoarcus sp.]|jgi:lipopolysaccharide export system protein LptC|nr:LPS export ABC transporter periplasmic protein LptC [Azoarcus sp.]
MPASHLTYRFYPAIVAALLAAGSIWLEHLTRAPESEAAAEADDGTPDFIAEGVRIAGFDDDGKLRYTLDSPRLTHLPQTDATLSDHPRLQLFRQGRRLWINADSGEASSKGEVVVFRGNVEAEREGADAEDVPLHFASASLTVWPQEQRAASNVPVRIDQGLNRADASRFEADNVFGDMKLSGKVRMSFPSRRRNP